MPRRHSGTSGKRQSPCCCHHANAAAAVTLLLLSRYRYRCGCQSDLVIRRKDIDFVLAAAADSELNLPSTAAARMLISEADRQGLQDADWAVGVSMLTPDTQTARSDTAAAAGEVFSSLAELEASLPAPWPEVQLLRFRVNATALMSSSLCCLAESLLS